MVKRPPGQFLSLPKGYSALLSPPSKQDAEFRDYVRLFERIERSSVLLDAQYRVPLTRIHFGWDAILGLVPIAGDLVSAGLSIRNMHLAYRLGASVRILSSMALNVFVDLLFGAVPIIGTLFDISYRANLRNLDLLMKAMLEQRQMHFADKGSGAA